jgi:aspartate/methionine/tyrosine aminotransferase
MEFASALVNLGIIVTPGQLISDEVGGMNPGENFVRFALVPTAEEVYEAAKRIKTSLVF